MDRLLTPSSKPPGARASGRTSPSTSIEVSWVSLPKASQLSAGTALLTNTACNEPVPSRMTTNATLPDDLTWLTHPRTRTVLPAWDGSSEMREYGATVIRCVVRAPAGKLDGFHRECNRTCGEKRA